MNSMIVTTMARGQITLPKKFREKYGIVPGMPLSVVDSSDGLMVTPLVGGYITKPKYSLSQYLAVLEKVSADIKTRGPLWTDQDDKLMKELREKDEERLKKLTW